ncbi:PsbP-related protein, partial [Crocosphaera sp.]
PSNIMRRNSDGKIVLIDFGAVKEVAAMESNQQGHTTITNYIGTPGYMPSEQAQGKPKFCSDIYAVGIIAIQGLTGLHYQQIIPDDNTGEIIWQNNVNVSSNLANVINTMVRYDFRERYQSGEEALQAVMDLIPKPQPPPSPPWKALVGVVFGTGLITTGIIFYIFTSRNSVPNYLLYENRNDGIKIKYPENSWDTRKTGNFIESEVVTLFPKNQNMPSCPAYVLIDVNNLDQILSLDEYKNRALKNIKNINSNTQITDSSNSSTTLSNRRAYKLVYNRRDGECSLKVMEIGTVRGGKAYFITYRAEEKQYSQLLPTVEKMINSFRIVEDN